MDSNHRSRKTADLQSAPFGHSGKHPSFCLSLTFPHLDFHAFLRWESYETGAKVITFFFSKQLFEFFFQKQHFFDVFNPIRTPHKGLFTPPDMFFDLSLHAPHQHNLHYYDPRKHAERIDRSIGHGGLVGIDRVVHISERHRVCHAATQQSAYRREVEF